MKLSACTIAKNEALNIGKSIDSYKDYVDEIIIVDTGSIDETIEIAESKGAKVLKFEWINDFAAAKNFALDNATGDWIIFLDADEWFDGDSAKNIREAIDRSIQSNYDSVACKLVNFYTETEIAETASTIRVFRHADNIRFNRAIHEALFDTNKNIALPGLYSELFVVNHSGYMKDLLDKKAKRNKALLDKNFALGNAAPIDYFYGMRENSKENPEVAEFFYKLIDNTKNYDELVSTFNISTSIDENKIKVVNLFPNKYSFSYRIKMIEDIQKKYPNNPTFKFYEYLLFDNVDKKRAIKALHEAIEFEKNFEKENIITNNAFYIKRSEAYRVLGEYYLFINDRVKALDCFTQAIKADYKNLKAFLGVLHIISSEKTEDIVLFINSIFEVSNKEVEEFLVEVLRISSLKDVFLYYFVDYYKKYEEVNKAFFTSRIYTNNFDEIIDKYLDVYKESKDERAFVLISSALIIGNCKEKFNKISGDIINPYSGILFSYFNNESMEKITEGEFQIVFEMFKEMAYAGDNEALERFLNIFTGVRDRLYFEVIKFFYSRYSYEEVVSWVNKYENLDSPDKELVIYFYYLLTNIYFRNNRLDKVSDCLEEVISGGLLEQDIVLLCEILEADDEKLQEYFELFDSLNFVKTNMMLDELEDNYSDAVRFMSIDKFKEEIKNKNISSLHREHLKLFFEFAEKAKVKKAFSIAEKYYKILIKYNYKVDKCYYALGEIYNYFEKPELSFYCYENAFIENFTLAKDILPKGHINSSYVFSKKEEIFIENCPVCGGKSKVIKTFVNINDENLTYNEPVIVKYCACEECGHIFVGNDLASKIFWDKEVNNAPDENKVSLYYDILENICEITDGVSILDCTVDNNEFRFAAENYGFLVDKNSLGKTFDIIFTGDLLNGTYDLEERLKSYVDSLTDEGVMVFELYDEGNAFSKLATKPLWVKVGVKNVFSKKSIEVLFNRVGLQILQINIDKINKGKIIVYAGK